MRRWILALVPVALLSFETGFAAGSDGLCLTTDGPAAARFTAADFCRDPGAVICTAQDIATYDASSGPRLRAFIKEARARVTATKTKARRRQFFENLENDILRSVGETRATLNSYFERAREELEQVARARGFSREIRERMIARIHRARLLLPSEALALHPKTVIKDCGEDGSKINAFASEGDSDADPNDVVVCPGFLLMGHRPGAPQNFEEPFLGLFETFTHELGHFVDFSDFGDELEPWHACLRDVVGIDAVQVQTSSGTLSLGRIDASRLNEFAADAWAVEAVSRHLRGLSRPALLHALREIYHSYCSGETKWKPDNPHMPDAARIDLILGEHPGVRAQLGCRAPTAAMPSCNLEGQVNGLPTTSP